MIDEATGKEMEKVYKVYTNYECDSNCPYYNSCWDNDDDELNCKRNASCEVTFVERFTDDDQHFLHLEYSFDSIWSDEMNFSELQKIVEECNLCIDELNTIRKTLNGNWEVKLTDGIFFNCHHEIEVPEVYYWCSDSSNTVDLGRIAECYKDCDKCIKCHNFWNEDCRDCDGCDAHPCTKINGRKALIDALGVDSL